MFHGLRSLVTSASYVVLPITENTCRLVLISMSYPRNSFWSWMRWFLPWRLVYDAKAVLTLKHQPRIKLSIAWESMTEQDSLPRARVPDSDDRRSTKCKANPNWLARVATNILPVACWCPCFKKKSVKGGIFWGHLNAIQEELGVSKRNLVHRLKDLELIQESGNRLYPGEKLKSGVPLLEA